MPEAAAELYEAAQHYESEQEGLGWRFRNEVIEVCCSIVQQPLLWRERPGGYRRVNCPVFPYYIPYFIRGDAIVIAAVEPPFPEREDKLTLVRKSRAASFGNEARLRLVRGASPDGSP